MYSYDFHIKAQKEYEASLKWYMVRSIKAAEGFISAVEETLGLICDNPARWRNEYKNLQELGVKKYPFIVIYIVEYELKHVLILSVFHAKRNPFQRYNRS